MRQTYKKISCCCTSIAAVIAILVASGCGGGEFSATPVASVVVDPIVTESPEASVLDELPDVARNQNEPLPVLIEPEPTVVLSSSGYPVKSNGSRSSSDIGPQSVDGGNVTNFPGLRYGDYLLKNNAWNYQNTTFGNWYQTIELEDTGADVVAKVDWDLGRPDQLNSFYDVTSYPELIYGTKSVAEVSASFSDTGLPVLVSESPEWEVDFAYRMQLRVSGADSNPQAIPKAEYNVAIESFWHSDCDIRRSDNNQTGNKVFEMMVWLRTGERKPSGPPPVAQFYTSGGLEFDVYVKSDIYGYIAYVATSDLSSGTLPYSEFIDDARSNAETYGVYPLQPSDCLANILMGPELWFGAGTFYWDLFRVNRNFYD